MGSNAYFPLFMDIHSKKIVVIGAGQIALRRIRILLNFCDQIIVIAPEAVEEILSLAREGRIHYIQKVYQKEDIYDAFLVLAATNQRAVNEQIYKDAKIRKIWINCCDDQNRCDFHFPSIVKKDEIVIGINAAGCNHHKVAAKRKEIQALLDGDKLYEDH